MNAPRILVINGHSNAGKSTFCAWLAEEAGFLHVDCDDQHGPRGITGHGLRTAWDEVVPGKGAATLQREVARRGQAVVLDWPYNPHPDCFAIVRTLQAAAIPVWWLDADRRAAHVSFEARARRSLSEFMIHADCVDQYRPELMVLYGRRFIETLRADSSRVPPDIIWGTICKLEGW